MPLLKIANRLLDECRDVLDDFTIRSRTNSTGEIFDKLVQGRPHDAVQLALQMPVSPEIDRIIKFVAQADRSPLEPLKPNFTMAVTIPHFNQTDYLSETLEHLRTQTRPPDEVIVVDDCSPDRASVERVVAEAQRRGLPALLVPSLEKLYCGGGRERGAQEATSDIVIMHDADDISHPRRLEFTEQFFRAHPDATHLTVGLTSFKGDHFPFISDLGSTEEMGRFVVHPAQVIATMRARFVNHQFAVKGARALSRPGHYGHDGTFGTHAGHVAYRRDLVGRIAWTTPSNKVFTNYEDYEFNLLLLLMFGRAYQLDLPLIYYRLGSSTNMACHGLPQD